MERSNIGVKKKLSKGFIKGGLFIYSSPAFLPCWCCRGSVLFPRRSHKLCPVRVAAAALTREFRSSTLSSEDGAGGPSPPGARSIEGPAHKGIKRVSIGIRSSLGQMMMRSRPQKASRVGPGVTAAQGALRVADHAADGSAGGAGETGGPAGARAETAEHPSGRTPAALGAIAVPPADLESGMRERGSTHSSTDRGSSAEWMV